MPGSGDSMLALARLGLHQRNAPAWRSLWIDLSDDLDVLRKRQNGKWRNMLVSAEKEGLSLSVDQSPAGFEWMVGHQEEMMKDLDFVGPDPRFLRSWASSVESDTPMTILKATEDGEPVAGICLARHGVAATYLLGWSGDRGRQVRASHFLIWQAVIYLKEAGVEWFDLGGVDEHASPGIAKFKFGTGGDRYDLVGEYLKW